MIRTDRCRCSDSSTALQAINGAAEAAQTKKYKIPEPFYWTSNILQEREHEQKLMFEVLVKSFVEKGSSISREKPE